MLKFLFLMKERGIQTVNFAYNSPSRIIYYIRTRVEINHIAEKEMEGLFSITKYVLSLFDNNEIKALFNNYGNLHILNYCVFGAKHSSSKVNEMVEQLKKDNYILNKLKNEEQIL